MSLLLRDVADRVELSSAEAIAIAQQLIAASPKQDGGDDAPSLGSVWLDAHGAVTTDPNASRADVASIGRLLYALLPSGSAGKVPGSLRYAIARAMQDVDAPPFASIGALSAALARHERDDRALLVAQLYARASAAPNESAIADEPDAQLERRRFGEAVAVLRRELRQADQALYESERMPEPAVSQDIPAERFADVPDAHPVDLPLHAPPTLPAHRAQRFRAGLWLLSGTLAALIAFAAGYAAVPLARRANHAPLAAPAKRQPALPAAISPHGMPASPEPAPARTPVSAVPLTRPTSAPDVALVHAVPSATGTSFSPSFASNGTALFFHTGQTSDAHSALEAAEIRGDDLRVMTILDDGAKNYHVRPSPDGTRIAFDSDRDGVRGVYVAQRDGKGARRLSGPGFAALPAWSPDGKTLAFVRAEPDLPKVWNLWLVDVATLAERRLTSYRYGQTWSASWFPDGRRVAYSHEDKLVIRDIEAGTTRELVSPVPNRLVRTPAVSPDGKHVIFQVSGSGAWLLDVESEAMRLVLTDPSAEEFAWAPDGRRVAFHSRRDGQWGIWVMAPPMSGT